MQIHEVFPLPHSAFCTRYSIFAVIEGAWYQIEAVILVCSPWLNSYDNLEFREIRVIRDANMQLLAILTGFL
jgi:hypothetical protein